MRENRITLVRFEFLTHAACPCIVPSFDLIRSFFRDARENEGNYAGDERGARRKIKRGDGTCQHGRHPRESPIVKASSVIGFGIGTERDLSETELHPTYVTIRRHSRRPARMTISAMAGKRRRKLR